MNRIRGIALLERAGYGLRAVRRARVDEHPRGGRLSLCKQRRGEPRQVRFLVSDGVTIAYDRAI